MKKKVPNEILAYKHRNIEMTKWQIQATEKQQHSHLERINYIIVLIILFTLNFFFFCVLFHFYLFFLQILKQNVKMTI